MAGSILDQLTALHGQLRRLREEVDGAVEAPPPQPLRLGELAGLWRNHGALRAIELEEVRLKAGSDS